MLIDRIKAIERGLLIIAKMSSLSVNDIIIDAGMLLSERFMEMRGGGVIRFFLIISEDKEEKNEKEEEEG